MININNKSKIKVHWKVSPYDFSKEKFNTLLNKLSKKYSLSKDRINIVVEPIMLNEKGEKISINNDIVNIQKPEFHLKLFKDFLSSNDIIDYDFELIKKIDSDINSKIDYNSYDQFRRYSINWIKWDNFLSYGEDNYFEFNKLNGLVLLNGEPANQSGKTTFAIDLIHFLLFGKTSKSATLEKIFNKHIPEATKMVVEGSLTIDGENFIIKRELTRTSLDKRNSKSRTTQKVSYYKVINDVLEELEEYVEDQQEESSIKTNKVIKEAIGNESDFDMIICATSSNLDELIEKKDTERGRLLSRWIGLIPIEEKDKIAREKFNSDVKPYLVSNQYNTEQLNQEIEAYKINIDTLKKEITKFIKENKTIDSNIENLERCKNALIESKIAVDTNVLKIDINTLNKSIENILNEGKLKNEKLASVQKELDEVGDLDFSIDEYDELVKLSGELSGDIKLHRQKYLLCEQNIKNIKESEICPTCKRKYDNVDNTEIISKLEKEKEDLIVTGKQLAQQHKDVDKRVEQMKEKRELYTKKTINQGVKASLEVQILNLRNDYKDKRDLLNDYNKNHEAIDKNNKLDIEIYNTDVNIKNLRNTKETNIRYIESKTNEISNFNKNIEDRLLIIKKIEEETKLLRHWRLYLDMVGKNGISKMVLRKTLPIINAQITNLLCDVCDFNVEITITDKNDIMFYLVKDGIKSDLTSGSGFERTAAALALRTVLGNISSLPKINFLIADEVMGRVAKENYDNMKTLYEKMLVNYDFIIQISHLDEIKDWHNHIVTVTKTNNVSKINIIR